MLQIIKTNPKDLTIFTGIVVTIIIFLTSPIFAGGNNENSSKNADVVAYDAAVEELIEYHAEQAAYNEALEDLNEYYNAQASPDEISMEVDRYYAEQAAYHEALEELVEYYASEDYFDYEMEPGVKVFNNDLELVEECESLLNESDILMTYQNVTYYISNK